jgi:hypothetical protein
MELELAARIKETRLLLSAVGRELVSMNCGGFRWIVQQILRVLLLIIMQIMHAKLLHPVLQNTRDYYKTPSSAEHPGLL